MHFQQIRSSILSQSQKSANNKQIFEEVYFIDEEDYTLIDKLLTQSVNQSFIRKIADDNKNGANVETDPNIFKMAKERLGQSKLISSRGFMEAQTLKPKLDEIIEQEEEQQYNQAYNYLSVRIYDQQSRKQIEQTSSCLACNPLQQTQSRCEIINDRLLCLSRQNYNGIFINFDTITAQLQSSRKILKLVQNTQIILYAGKYMLVFENPDPKIIAYWNKNLKRCIATSKGTQKNLTKLKELENFYSTRYETEQYFLNNCSTGDIILFQDNHFFAKAQRFFTRSKYDHVAMIIKDAYLRALIFESTSDSGVNLIHWSSVVKFGWYKTIPKITWRRLLNVQKNDKFYEIAYAFVNKTLRTKYHISLGKLMSNNSVLYHSNRGQTVPTVTETVSQGYFCSQLIATLYKQVGLLTRDTTQADYKPSCRYYPYDFTQKANLKLEKGNLSPQFELYFDPLLLKDNYPEYNFDNES